MGQIDVETALRAIAHPGRRQILELAAAGLRARAEEDWAGQDERQFLTALRAVVESHLRLLDLDVVALHGGGEEYLLEESLPFEAGNRKGAVPADDPDPAEPD